VQVIVSLSLVRTVTSCFGNERQTALGGTWDEWTDSRSTGSPQTSQCVATESGALLELSFSPESSLLSRLSNRLKFEKQLNIFRV